MLKILIILLLIPTTLVFAEKPHVEDTLIVKFHDGVSQDVQKWLFKKEGIESKESIKEINTQILNIPENKLYGMMTKLSKNPMVEYVDIEQTYEPALIPNDPYFPNQWYLTKTNTPVQWDKTTGNGIILAIVDTGFKLDHPDLRFIEGYNVVTRNNQTANDNLCSHGTRVAGVIGAITNNTIGVSGISWNSKILPISVSSTSCSVSSSTLAKGIIYAADHGADVVNLSFGIYGGDRTITQAAKHLYSKGGVLVAASGNSGQTINSKNNQYIISVGATDKNDVITTFSTKGKFVDFVAPGVSIYTTAVYIPYSSTAGTSFSTPIVTGVIGLILSQNPSLTPNQIYDELKQRSIDLGSSGYDTSYGWGRIDLG